MTDRAKRVREDVPAADDLDDVEGHARWDLPGDEQPASTSTTPAHDPGDRA